MAKLKGLFQFEGTLAGVSADRNGVLSMAPPKRAITAVRTLENNSEFGAAATAGKTFRDSFRQIVANISDKVATSRLTKLMRAIIATDAVNDRGQRGVIDAEIELLKGFEFNGNSILSTIMYGGFTALINRVTGAHKVEVEAFDCFRDIAAPTGTTHVKLVASASSIDFEMKESDNVVATSAAIPYKVGTVAAQTLALGLPAASVHPIALVYGCEFYQEVNGRLYLLGNGAYTTAKVVEVNGN